MHFTNNETFISVDVETSGPNPSQYSLLSIGACTLDEPPRTFYVELQPLNDDAMPQAMAVNGLSLKSLKTHGLPPPDAMSRFEDWLGEMVPEGSRPVFVAFNAPFDWMFVNDYFHRFLGRNPFGHSALDIKALFMGLSGSTWGETRFNQLATHYLLDLNLAHHALRDALDQADIFRQVLSELQSGEEK